MNKRSSNPVRTRRITRCSAALVALCGLLASAIPATAQSTEADEVDGGDAVLFGAFEFPRFYVRRSEDKVEAFRRVMTEWRELGVDRVFYHPRRASPKGVHPTSRVAMPEMHRIAHEVGIDLIPILNTMQLAGRAMRRAGVEPEQYMQIYQPSGTVGHRKEVSPLHPGVREAMRDAVRNWAEAADELHLKTLAFDDEFGLRVAVRGAGLTDYNPHAIAWVKEHFGVDPVVPEPIEPGTVIELDDPAYRWLDATRRGGGHFASASPILQYHNRDLAEVARAAAPDLTLMQMPGAVSGELDAVTHELYEYGWGTPELASLGEYQRTAAEQHHLPPDERKPIWPLIGWYQHLPFPEWIGPHVNLMAKLMAAQGSGVIDFASLPLPWDYHGGRDTRPDTSDFRDFEEGDWFAGHDDLREAYLQLQKDIEKHAPLLQTLEPEPMPIGVLYSRTTQMFQIGTRWPDQRQRLEVDENPWVHGEVWQIAWPALKLAHLPVEVVTEPEIRDGALERYDTLILANAEYLPRDVHDAIEAFAAGGGNVVADASTAFAFPGAKPLHVDFTVFSEMVQLGLRRAPMFSSGEMADIVRTRTDLLARQFGETIERRWHESLPKSIDFAERALAWQLKRDPATGERILIVFNTDLRDAVTDEAVFTHDAPASATLLTSPDQPRVAVDERGAMPVEVAPGDWAIYRLHEAD